MVNRQRTIGVPDDMWAEIGERAKRLGVTRSAYIRAVISLHLKNEEESD